MTTPDCQLYLISPLDVGGDFAARLEEALSAAPVAAFQFRVKGVDQHEAARLAEPLRAICAAHGTAFIVHDEMRSDEHTAELQSLMSLTNDVVCVKKKKN